MSIKNHITDPSTGFKASVVNGGEENALVVATRDLIQYYHDTKNFTDANGSVDMNISISVGATPENVHDGIDKIQWTASAIVGTNFTFDLANTHAKEATITVLDKDDLGGDDIVININGSATTKSEPGDWVGPGAANNDACATNIATAIDGITGVSASASGAVVTIIADPNYDIQSLTTTGAVADITVSARAISAVGALTNDTMQLNKGVDLDLTNYVTLSGWIYLTKWNILGLTITGWDISAGLPVGNSVNIGNYINTGTLNVWQRFAIPLTDLGIAGLTSTFDSLRITILHPSVDVYLDYIRIQQTGTSNPVSFSIMPEKGTWYYMYKLTWILADALNISLVNGTAPGLSYNKILDVTQLSSGIVYQRIQDDEVIQSSTIRSLGDILTVADATVTDVVCDGTNTFIKLVSTFTEPIVLKSEDNDKLRITINDDLSGLLIFKGVISGKERRLQEESHIR